MPKAHYLPEWRERGYPETIALNIQKHPTLFLAGAPHILLTRDEALMMAYDLAAAAEEYDKDEANPKTKNHG